jgi:acyl carrier protein
MPQISDADIERRVLATIVRVFRLTPEEARGELRIGVPPQWDSLGHMQLMVEIENEFNVRFQTHEIAGLETVEKIVGAIGAHNGAQ